MGVARAATAYRWLAVAFATTAAVSAAAMWSARPVVVPGTGPDALLRMAARSAGVPFEGFAETRGSLGLPDLPRLGEVAALLGSTTRARVWWGSERDWRVDTVTAVGETGTYAVGGTLHTWDYGPGSARVVEGNPPVRLPRADDLLPPEATRRLLSGEGTAGAARRIGTRRVAGVAAIGVSLVPAEADSSVARADVWIEPRTGLPLALELYPRGADQPALTSHFLDLRLRTPDAGVLRPRDVALEREVAVPVADLAAAVDRFAATRLPRQLAGMHRSADVVGLGGSATYGRGLARLVVLPLPGRLGRQALDAAEGGGGVTLDVAPNRAVQVSTPLLTAVVAHAEIRGPDPSYLVVGTITADAMQRAVADLLAGAR